MKIKILVLGIACVINTVIAGPVQSKFDERGFLDFLMHLIPLFTSIQDDVKDDLYASVHNPFQHSIGYVRSEKRVIPTEEILWRSKRFINVKKAQEKFLGMQLADDDILDIGISLSGGGFRAMLGALGSMNIAEKEGLLDCVMTVAGLSGSTWFIGPWITQGESIADRKAYLLDRLKNGIIPDHSEDAQWMAERLMLKFGYEQPLTSIDVYGTLLANRLLDWDPKFSQDACLYGTIIDSMVSHRDRIAQAMVPFPVYTATLVDNNFPPYFFEFTPYEVGCRDFNSYVPSWAFGRKFNEGTSCDVAPEQSLGFIMGVAGSAFGIQFRQIYLDIIQNHITNAELLKLLDSIFNSDIGNLRLTYAEVNNFMYGLANCLYNKQRILKLVDAGGVVNNPIFATYRTPPLGSEPDIIITFDYGDGGFGYQELSISARYAKSHGYKFPNINDPNSGSRILTVFKDDFDSTTPVLIYMPSINDQKLVSAYSNNSIYSYYYQLLDNVDWNNIIENGYANTLNFNYTKLQAETVCALHEFNLLTQIKTIKQVMRDRILAKRMVTNE